MLHSIGTRLRGLLQRPRVTRELDDELQFHLDMAIRENLNRGMSPEEARRRAVIAFGGIAQTAEAVRNVRWSVLDTGFHDIRHALRRLNKERHFAAAAIITIGLAVGLNTAVFSVTNAVLLRPLPYHDPDRLVLVGRGDPGGPPAGGLSEPEYYDWLERNRVFEGMAIETFWRCELVEFGSAQPLEGAKISANLLTLFGVKPLLGRPFLPGEEQPGRDKVVLLSEDTWRHLFGGDPHILGKHIRFSELGGEELFEVVGITPRSFRLHYSTIPGPFRIGPGKAVNVFRPLVPLGIRNSETARLPVHYKVYARLKAGITVLQARAACFELQNQLKREHPASVQTAVGAWSRRCTRRRSGAPARRSLCSPLRWPSCF